jgi:hypothetical protein
MFLTSARLTGNIRYSINGNLSTQNPLSDSGKWRNGLTDGLDWNDCRIVNGAIHGTNFSSGPPYTDNVAVLIGTARPNQKAKAKVKQLNAQTDPIFQEVEFRFRSCVAPHMSQGYEINFRAASSGWYSELIRWNGPLGVVAGGGDGAFTSLVHYTGSPSGVVDGDIIESQIIGSVVTTKINGNQIWTYDTASDAAPTGSGTGSPAVYSNGQPGIGFYMDGSSNAALLTDFGFYWIEMSDLP